MRKALALILCLVMLLGVFPMSAATAEGKAEKLPEANAASVGEGEILYLTGGKNTATLQEAQATEGVSIVSTNSVQPSRIENAFYVIVDYNEIVSNKVLLDKIKEMIANDKIVFIRANGQETCTEELYNLLGYKETNGTVILSEIEDLKAKYQTYGYMAYLDGESGLQVVMQEFEDTSINFNLSEKELEEGTLTEESRKQMTKVLSAIEPYSFSLEIEASKAFVSDVMSMKAEEITDPCADELTDISASFSTTYHYQKNYYTKTFTIGGKTTNTTKYGIGQLTVIIRANRIAPEDTYKDNNGVLRPIISPANIKPGRYETTWVFLAVIRMKPLNPSSNFIVKVMNKSVEIKMSTLTKFFSSATYKKEMDDYLPKTDTSGQTDVTYTIGINGSGSKPAGKPATGSVGANFGVTWKVSYKDITFTVDDYWGASRQYVKWVYKMNANRVRYTSIELVPGVRVNNKNTTNLFPNAAVTFSAKGQWRTNIGTVDGNYGTYTYYAPYM